MLKDFSVSTITAGFVASLVGLTSSIAIVFEAARTLGATDDQIASWVWAICLGMAVLTIVPSIVLRTPVMVAFSTPGAVVIATLTPGDFTLAQGVGAFMMSGALVALVGFSGLFERFLSIVPVALANALLAGVLCRFAINGFADAARAPWLIVTTTLVFLVMRQLAPRYSVIAILIVGVATAALSNTLVTDELALSMASPVLVPPVFDPSAFVSITVPLFIVTMAGQNLPGVAALRASEYSVPVSKVVGSTGVGTAVLAPWGGFTFNLSAITAAICMERSAHEDPARRYTAAISNGGFYLLAGIFGASITGALRAFPSELVHIVAGLALMPTIGTSLSAASADPIHREAAMFTFLVTLSGVTVAKIGSPFWGALTGLAAMAIAAQAHRRRS